MPSPEVSLQRDLFTGELVDNRSRRQKQADRSRALPQQAELFSAREVAQFGVRARPLIPLAPGTSLVLISDDPRTPEEKERDAQRAAEERTQPMFGESPESARGSAVDENTIG